MMGNPVEQGRCYFCISEQVDPFSEAEAGDDNHTESLAGLGEEAEEQRTA